MKYFLLILFSLLLAGCAGSQGGPGITKQQVGTVAGGVAGGALGSQIFHGSSQVYGAIGGAILGSLIGSSIGQYMDQQDKLNAERALIYTPVGQEAVWKNSKTGTTYTVRPVDEYAHGDQHCRRAWMYVDGTRHKAYTTICQRSDGKWYLKS